MKRKQFVTRCMDCHNSYPSPHYGTWMHSMHCSELDEHCRKVWRKRCKRGRKECSRFNPID